MAALQWLHLHSPTALACLDQAYRLLLAFSDIALHLTPLNREQVAQRDRLVAITGKFMDRVDSRRLDERVCRTQEAIAEGVHTVMLLWVMCRAVLSKLCEAEDEAAELPDWTGGCHVFVLVYGSLLSSRPWEQEPSSGLEENQQWSLWSLMLLAGTHLYTITPSGSQASVVSMLFLGNLASTHLAKLVPMGAGLLTTGSRFTQRYWRDTAGGEEAVSQASREAMSTARTPIRKGGQGGQTRIPQRERSTSAPPTLTPKKGQFAERPSEEDHHARIRNAVHQWIGHVDPRMEDFCIDVGMGLEAMGPELAIPTVVVSFVILARLLWPG